MQACARQVLGEEEVSFKDFYAEPECRAACDLYGIIGGDGKVKRGHGYFWAHDNWKNTWSIDAFTIDPSKMMSDYVGVWEVGRERPVEEVRCANAGPGDMPKVHVFLASHPQHGIHAFYPHRSCTGGGEGAFEGYGTWVDTLTEEQARFIRESAYYNFPCAWLTPDLRQRMREQPFDPEEFRVRSSALPPLGPLSPRLPAPAPAHTQPSPHAAGHTA